MPKETKKFINPLLRPSSTAEQNERGGEKPSRKAPPAKASSPSTEPLIETKAPTPEQNVAAQEERIVEQVVVPQVRGARRLSKAAIAEDSETKTDTRMPTSPETQTSVETSTSTSLIENITSEETLPIPAKEAPEIQSQIQLPSLTNTSEISAQSVPLYRDQIKAEHYAENLPQYPGDSYAPGPLAHTASTSFAPPPAPLSQEEQHAGELLNANEFSALGAVRRRRGGQTFEKTHERITLWIDKRLKQAFDELAYEQELPKTALLNEAIADLLRKYRA